MNLQFTKKQSRDLETIEYFIPEKMKNTAITDEDRKMFLEFSERGLHKDKTNLSEGFSTLCEGKKWRGIHIHELYEQGILDGSVPYYSLLEGMPRSVVLFLKKEMFKGKDADLIERVYETMS